VNADVVPVRYRAFLSYSHQDERWAKWLHRSLEVYRPPQHLVGQVTELGAIPRRLTPIFRDREELPSATDLGELINQALARSACQIVICSPRAAQSHWVNEEILAFKRLGGEHRIFCLIVDGEPNASDKPGQEQLECFPPALRFRLGADGKLGDTRSEPIAADARQGKDGRAHAKLKLIAGMLGVGFDTLRRREQQRRHRQLAVIAGAALTGMVLTSGLAAVALVARANAERQRVRAEAEAETARQTTGFLVDLFRISDPGEARGNSVTAREMLDKGAERIKVELADQPAIQATLMDTVGSVYMSLGLYQQARPLLESALARRRAAVDEHPAAVPETLNHLGDLLSLQAEYQEAERNYRAAVELQRQVTAPDTHSGVQSRATVARSQSGLGYALLRLGRLPEAERALRDSLAIQRGLYSGANADVARTLQDLSLVVSKRGDLKNALPVMEQALAMQRELRGALPHPALAETLNNLGLLLYNSAEYQRSGALLEEAVAMKRKLLGERHPEIAVGLNNLAMLMQDKGDLARAESMFRQALTMHRELVGNEHPEVANTLNNLAFVLYEEGQVTAALSAKRESLAIYQRIFPGDHPETAATMNTIGYWLMEQSRFRESEQVLTAGLEMRRRLLGAEHPNVGSSLSNLAMLQVARHRYDEALRLAREASRIFALSLPPAHWRVAVAHSAEGAALAGLSRFSEAQKLLIDSYAQLNRDKGVLPTYPRRTRRYLESLYSQWGRPEEARRYAGLAASVGRSQIR
jgi:tetratricopeptide (TPR) repeat protein